ncbi:FUN14 domain-containing protein 2-like [Lineus longissimus]|uniref:FUN14 domain-containing protein 2-like n=1 Tax=Lineus longissimus TaxID=88925 RepID=UPI002B4F28C5
MAEGGQNPDENFEVIDLSEIRNAAWLRRMAGDIQKASAAKQITFGGVGGWATGYVCSKIGKAAATAIGGSLILLQIAHYKGYIKIDWNKVEKEWKSTKTQVRQTAGTDWEYYIEETRTFVKKNMFLAGGFAGGFLIGLAS